MNYFEKRYQPVKYEQWKAGLQNAEKKYVIVSYQDDCDEKTGTSMEVKKKLDVVMQQCSELASAVAGSKLCAPDVQITE